MSKLAMPIGEAGVNEWREGMAQNKQAGSNASVVNAVAKQSRFVGIGTRFFFERSERNMAKTEECAFLCVLKDGRESLAIAASRSFASRQWHHNSSRLFCHDQHFPQPSAANAGLIIHWPGHTSAAKSAHYFPAICANPWADSVEFVYPFC